MGAWIPIVEECITITFRLLSKTLTLLKYSKDSESSRLPKLKKIMI